MELWMKLYCSVFQPWKRSSTKLGYVFNRDSSPKNKILSLITRVVPNRKTFIHLQNTNQDIFDEIQELSDPA